jgi:hypothetical protein
MCGLVKVSMYRKGGKDRRGGGNGKGWDRRRWIVEIVFFAWRNLIPAAWFPVHSQLIPNLSSAYSLRGSPCFQLQKRNLSDYLCLSLTNAFICSRIFSQTVITGRQICRYWRHVCLLMSPKRRVSAAHGRIVQPRPTSFKEQRNILHSNTQNERYFDSTISKAQKGVSLSHS